MEFEQYLNEAEMRISDNDAAAEFLNEIASMLDNDYLDAFFLKFDRENKTSFSKDIKKVKDTLFVVIEKFEELNTDSE
jgi:hypothetical protein